MTKKILILPGDGIGKEVTSSMNEVLHYLIDEQNLDFQLSERKVGGSSFDEFGKPLTEETLDMAKNSDAILFGAVGGPSGILLIGMFDQNKLYWGCANLLACLLI